MCNSKNVDVEKCDKVLEVLKNEKKEAITKVRGW